MRAVNGWLKLCFLVFVCGTASAQTFKTLISFDGADGENPDATAIVQGPDGNLYSTAVFGGVRDAGTMFGFSPSGAMRFLSLSNHYKNPSGGLLLGSDGNFYGTTVSGGENHDGQGNVFEVRPSGRLSMLYSFTDTNDGWFPRTPLIQASDGNFYGTTTLGGLSSIGGTVFRITADGVLTTLYEFCTLNNCQDGASSFAGLLQASDGNFYGTTNQGGDPTCTLNNGYGCGTIFRITPDGVLTTLHVFEGSDGDMPIGALIQATDGSFYGTTSAGGTVAGTVFKISLSGDFSTIYNFCSAPDCADGVQPVGGVIQATDGNLYGTTEDRGYGSGVLFRMTTSGVLTILHEFCVHQGCTDGAMPSTVLLQATNGKFYGMTLMGGANNKGTVYSLNVGLAPFVSLVTTLGDAGQSVGILGQGLRNTSGVSFNGVPATFKVLSDTSLSATVPVGVSTGYVTVTTPSGVLTSNKPFMVAP